MASVFNVFSNTSNNIMSTTEHFKETKSINYTSGIMAKSFDQCKPKGLSIRSKSDLNIAATSSPITFKKDESNNSFFPKNELINKQLLFAPTEFDKAESVEFNKDKIFEQNILRFKEPYVVEKDIQNSIFSEPEDLAPYYDPELELNNYNINLENEFSKCMLHAQDDTDEGFGSEMEELSYPEMTIHEQSMQFSDYDCGSPHLSEISDNETV
ncbi:PREDICTED: uncharacterized protein LOC106793132 [Polistes canadensis]|uniref:uncharacterized protein LOC106793132 n=1 Tax=Polistes canadensis TaxID=91411 RepID=UPI000718C885|nr:PREDICTED: uncharacterized protein LOC106793132 [Polistes canadensis]